MLTRRRAHRARRVAPAAAALPRAAWAGLEGLEGRLLLDAQWTVMVWLSGESTLEGSALTDFVEMARVGSSDQMKVVAQLDRSANSDEWFGYDSRYGDWSGARRGLINPHAQPDTSWGTSVGEVNMGDPAALKTFATWAQTTYPADRYALILWGHGDGFYGVCMDEGNDDDALTLSEIESVLSTLPEPVDLIGFDACLMGMIEVAYQLQDDAAVMVASQETESERGWSYNKVLQDLQANPDWTAAQLGAAIVDRFREDYNTSYAYDTLSCLDLAQVGGPGGLAAYLSAFADAVIYQSTAADVERLKEIWYYTPFFGEFDRMEAVYSDLGDFLYQVAGDLSLGFGLSTTAQAARFAYDDAVLSNFSGEWAFSTGISIYLPEYGTLPPPEYNRQELRLLEDTSWGQFLSFWSSGALPAPDLDVLGAGRPISCGSLRPDRQDGTDFGSVVVGGADRPRDFTLRNGGSAEVQLTGQTLVEITGPGAADFAVTVMPSDRIAPGQSTTCQITFHPTTGGLREATVRILSNDADESPYTFAIRGTGYAPGLTLSDAFVLEGNEGTVQALFKVTISEAPKAAVEVSYATSDNNALAGQDYQAAAGVLAFQPGGARIQWIPVTILPDAAPELDETLFLTLSDPKNATLGKYRAVGTIRNDDGQALPFGGTAKPTVTEYDGDLVTVSLAGQGAGTVLLDNAGHIVGLETHGTGTASTLTVTVRKAGNGDGVAAVGGIQVDGSLKALSAKGASLDGLLRIHGLCGSIALGDVLTGSTILVNAGGLGVGTRDALTVCLGLVTDASLDSGGLPIRSLTAAEWANSPGTPAERITAPSLATLSIKGDKKRILRGNFGAELALSGNLAGGLTAGRLTIAGNVQGGAWQIDGNVGTIRITGSPAGWTLQGRGPAGEGLGAVKSVQVGDASDCRILAADALGTVRALRWLGGGIEADRVDSLAITGDRRNNVPGDFTGELMLRGLHLPARKAALGSATIAGQVRDCFWQVAGDVGAVKVAGCFLRSDLRASGSIASLTLGAAEASDVFAGAKLAALQGDDRRANEPGDFGNLAATIRSIAVNGWKVAAPETPPRFVIDSNFSAPNLGTVRLTNAAGGAAYGLHVAGDDTHIRSIRLRDTLYPKDLAYNQSWKPGQEWLAAGTALTVDFII